MADFKGLTFEKLNNRNWSTWKFRIEMLLSREEVWHVIAQPKPETVNDQWKKADLKARATIGLCIDESQYSVVKSADSAKGVWDKLCAFHEKSTITTQVALLNKLWNMNLPDGGDVELHVRELEEIFERLAAADHVLTESFKVVLLFRSLPESYQGLATLLQSQMDAGTTLEAVKVKVLEEYERRSERSGRASATVSGEANAMKSVYKKSSVVKTCFHCGQTGHFRRDCPAWKKSKKGDADKKKPQAKPSAKKVDDDSDDDSVVCFMATSTAVKRNVWFVDSGASCHMTNDEQFFTKLVKKDGPNVVLADGKVVKTIGCGYGTLRGMNKQGGIVDVKISDVLLVPSLTSGLLSVDKLTSKGYTAVFDSSGCDIRDKNDKVVVVGVRSGSLYRLQLGEVTKKVDEKTHNTLCRHQWHRRLGHRHPGVISRITNEKLGEGLKIVECGIQLTCEPCIEGKLARNPMPKVAERKSTQVLDLIHTDLCGPMRTTTPGGKRFLMTMIDDYSRYTVVYLLAKKSEAQGKIKEYVRFVETLFGRKPKIVRSDGGGEYCNDGLRMFFADEGISAQYSTAYTPQHNGVAERKNRSLQEMARTMLLDADLPKRYWGESVVAAAFLQNRLPSRSVDTTPYEKWYGRKPELGYLRVYGCQAYVHIPDVKRGKFDGKARKLRFIGYSGEHKGYRFVDTSTDKVTISRDARFLELGDGSSQPNLQPVPESGEVWWPLEETVEQEAVEEVVPPEVPTDESEDSEYEEDDCEDSECEDYLEVDDLDPEADPLAVKQEEVDQEEDQEEDQPVAVRHSSRRTRGVPPKYLSDYVADAAAHSEVEPVTFEEAMSCPERDAWVAAMESELESHRINGTWELVPLPKGRKLVGCRWIYKLKRNEANEIVRYKARIVAQGFTQTHGVDYEEVFAPVTRHATLRALLTLAAKKNLVLKHLDVRTAYLYGDINEELYMKQPPGYVTQGEEEFVCRLRRSIYGLKQSARCWNEKLTEVLKKIGFEASAADPCLFVATVTQKKVFLIVYVDDLILGCESDEVITYVHEQLKKSFDIECLGDVKFFLGLEVKKTNNVYSLCLANYIDQLVARVGLSDAKVSKTPMDKGFLCDEVGSKPLEDVTKFRSAVGALMYIAVCTRPDIMTSAAILGRKFSSPTESDWTAAKRVVRYLKGTRDWRLNLGGEDSGLVAFSDSDWAGDTETRKSTTGYVVFYSGGALSWASRRQDCVTLSTLEAEYVALTETCQEVIWLRRLLGDLEEEQRNATVINEDNQGCLSFARSERFSKRSKHIETKLHFVKNLCEREEVVLKYCPTEDMKADILTKPLGGIKHHSFAKQLGLVGDD